MKYKNILFDLDGTLTDPKIGITKAVQYALSKLDINENDLKKLEIFIGPPLQKSFAELYSLSDEDAWKAVEYYREYFQACGMYENQVYPGIRELLISLFSAGKILDHFNLSAYFANVYGSELDGTRSDKTELIDYIIQKHDLDKSRTIMIGDRKYDMIGARNNKIDSMAVSYGYGSEEELLAENPTYLVGSVKHILQAIRRG